MRGMPDKSNRALQAEADGLEEILKNTAHPKNLVAVRKSGTPVVATPSLTAKPQFLASMHDEFEMLDFNADWVHVRISGLSRGWIWRNSVEMPEGIANTDAPTASALAPAADLFHVVREEASTFPGDWEPLRNKNVKIIHRPEDRRQCQGCRTQSAAGVCEISAGKELPGHGEETAELAGVVVIFDSADGGMIAATLASCSSGEPALCPIRPSGISVSLILRKPLIPRDLGSESIGLPRRRWLGVLP